MIAEVARLSRRSVVGAVAVGAVAGCAGGGGGDGSGGGPAGAVARPGAAEQAGAVRDSMALLRAYDATLAAHPALAGRLAPLRAEVARHVRAFGGQAPASSPGRTAHPVPAGPAAALAALAAMERTLADRRAVALLAVPGELARLMASVAAAGAGHVVLLNTGAKKA
ncbi:hypothetical protein [Streptomyces sp.]|uniref:hypothetical protein n=1 Tax=Streptomyces sp. TaxID=1931 RepID=UPI002F42010F